MLIQFSVENYKSIKNKVTLSFEASTDKVHAENFIYINAPKKEKILKSINIYGANASGKSNIFMALTAAIMTIRSSSSIQPGMMINNIVPFKFDAETIKKPTSFEFVFLAEDSKKYVYSFSVTRERVVSESLFAYYSAKPTMIFKRITGVYEFSAGYIKKLKPLSERTTDNKLFLAVATTWNCKETAIPFNWFMTKINTYSNRYDEVLHITGEKFEKDDDKTLKQFTIDILHAADINISDYQFSSKEVKTVGIQNNILPNQPFSGFPVLNVFKEYEIKTKHVVDNSNGKQEVELDFSEESFGTRSLFFLSPLLKNAFEKGEVVCIDEFDASLHPLLVGYIVSLFNNPNINKSNAQLVASVHTTELMDLKKFRRDQIYFTNKNRKTAATELYSLDEFSVRKSDNIRNSYLLGRYDAIPNIISQEF